jgi:hypothetical protein
MKVYFIGLETKGVSDHCTKTWNFQSVQAYFWGEMKSLWEMTAA